jgi:hypothetical protein
LPAEPDGNIRIGHGKVLVRCCVRNARGKEYLPRYAER